MASGDLLFALEASSGKTPTTTAAARMDRRGNDGHVVFDFNDATDVSLDFSGWMPNHYGGGGVTLTVGYMMSSATTNEVRIDAAFERHQDDAFDLDTDGLAAVQSVTDTVPSASGEMGYATITFTDGAQMDSLAVNEHFRLRITRDADNVADDASGDMELLSIMARET